MIHIMRPEIVVSISTGERLVDEWPPLKRNLWLVGYYFKRDILPPLYVAIVFVFIKMAVEA
jgi:hypothetical protein